MKLRYSSAAGAAAVIACSMAAFAQATPPQTPSTTTASTQQGTAAADQSVTVAGCLQREADYRRSRDAGRGGVVGTGVGAANEFGLVNASMSAAAGSGAAATTGATAGTATGTAGTTTGIAYELTGANEGQAAQHVGRRVEISGKLKPAAVEPTGRPTGGVTAGKPPEGIDVASQDLRLRELEVTSVREMSGTCPAL